LNDAALVACDAADGLKDGIVPDPRACKFDPAVLLCKQGQSGDSCLTQAQVTAVGAMYSGVKAPDGEFAAFPLSRGSERGWDRFVATTPPAQGAPGAGAAGGGMGGLRALLFSDANFDLAKFSAERDFATVRSTAFAREYEAKDPNIAPFFSKGGKLILWHGFDDPGPSPLATVDYYQKVRKVTGDAKVDSDMRFYLLPGVYHCRGGPGADTFDSVAALDAWVDQGKAPETLLATRADGKLSRPLCRYPKQPHYKGSGDPGSAESFECK
jgi:feruloyl esterase